MCSHSMFLLCTWHAAFTLFIFSSVVMVSVFLQITRHPNKVKGCSNPEGKHGLERRISLQISAQAFVVYDPKSLLCLSGNKMIIYV